MGCGIWTFLFSFLKIDGIVEKGCFNG